MALKYSHGYKVAPNNDEENQISKNSDNKTSIKILLNSEPNPNAETFDSRNNIYLYENRFDNYHNASKIKPREFGNYKDGLEKIKIKKSAKDNDYRNTNDREDVKYHHHGYDDLKPQKVVVNTKTYGHNDDSGAGSYRKSEESHSYENEDLKVGVKKPAPSRQTRFLGTLDKESDHFVGDNNGILKKYSKNKSNSGYDVKNDHEPKDSKITTTTKSAFTRKKDSTDPPVESYHYGFEKPKNSNFLSKKNSFKDIFKRDSNGKSGDVQSFEKYETKDPKSAKTTTTPKSTIFRKKNNDSPIRESHHFDTEVNDGSKQGKRSNRKTSFKNNIEERNTKYGDSIRGKNCNQAAEKESYHYEIDTNDENKTGKNIYRKASFKNTVEPEQNIKYGDVNRGKNYNDSNERGSYHFEDENDGNNSRKKVNRKTSFKKHADPEYNTKYGDVSRSKKYNDSPERDSYHYEKTIKDEPSDLKTDPRRKSLIRNLVNKIDEGFDVGPTYKYGESDSKGRYSKSPSRKTYDDDTYDTRRRESDYRESPGEHDDYAGDRRSREYDYSYNKTDDSKQSVRFGNDYRHDDRKYANRPSENTGTNNTFVIKIRPKYEDSGNNDSAYNSYKKGFDIGDPRNGYSGYFYDGSSRTVTRNVSFSLKNGDPPPRQEREYNDRGVVIKEKIEGTPCDNCADLCPGFTSHTWRKTCQACKCPRESHAVYHDEWVSVRDRLGFKPPSGDTNTPVGQRGDAATLGYSWVPPGLPGHKVDVYFRALPADKVPRLGDPGERYRDRQLSAQLPKQDLALAYCKHVEAAHKPSYEDFIAARNEIALDIGYIKENNSHIDCQTCQKPVSMGSLAVVAPKFGEQVLWHPSCFACTTCNELLVDLTYCVHDDLIYCERHYAEMLKPRCSACDELIFSGEYTKAMNKDWHSGHFCCWQCDESLTGQRYVLRDDHPYCIKCYESVFANGCEECNKTIGIDSKDLSYKEKHWHESCFLCTKCRVSLVDKQFGSKSDKIYCGNCYDTQFASRCDGCGEIFRAGTKKMEYKTRQWHEKCFCCVVCKSAIGTKSFIPREQEIYCAGCYEEKFATRCVKCNKIITSGGVTYKNEPWHRECFTCTNCSTSLAGQRFTSRDEKPYCADCFGELFAKRCTACVKPITGIGGTRFISFEDRHWHNDCFICASCKTSLVGRGFITDATDIICPECAKNKLT